VAHANHLLIALRWGAKKELLMAKKQKKAVRNYLIALRDPNALRDQVAIADLKARLDQCDDGLERLQLRQQLLDLERPSPERYEEAFVEHAKAWATSVGVTGAAFAAEGVPASVLRRAGFDGVGGARRRGRAATPHAGRTRGRVSADEIRAAIPSGTFTVSDLQQRSGASAAVVRRVIREQVAAGRLAVEGADPAHTGPGRAPSLYRRT
jgi:hypothetical protein